MGSKVGNALFTCFLLVLCSSILAYAFRRALAPIVGKATFKLQSIMNNRHDRGIALPDDDIHGDLEQQRLHHQSDDNFDISDDETAQPLDEPTNSQVEDGHNDVPAQAEELLGREESHLPSSP